MTICSIYLPPGVRTDISDVVDVIDQLPSPFILMGDFNAHNVCWGSVRNDRRGRNLESLFTNLNMTILNSGSETHFCAATRSFSAIDLTVSSAAIAPLFEWEVHPDLSGSDHFPILLKPLFASPCESRWPRWVLKKADWQKFSESVSVDEERSSSIDEEVNLFTDSITCAAKDSIPLSSTSPRRVPVPWWNENCDTAHREKRLLFARFRRHPTEENMVDFLRAKARLKRIVKESKRESWRSYVSSVTVATPVAKVWEKVRKISGLSSSPPISGLSLNGTIVTSQVEIANTLATTFAAVSSSNHFPPEFLTRKAALEHVHLSFVSRNEEDYNQPLTRGEFDSALSGCKDSSPGPDAIHYQMIRHLPESSKRRLLEIFNRIWSEGTCPNKWKESFVIPVPKVGKDRKCPSSYRPISLTSCVCKLLERIINGRLVWFLETNHLLSNAQCGFRRHRSTADHLARLEAAIRDALITRQHLVAVFFDIEKAYDTTWRFGILRTLHSWGLRGRMISFIEDFMSNRSFRVRIGNNVSQSFPLENGVPQGSILSVTLFLVAINGAAQCIRPPVESSLYVDDLAIYSVSRNIASVQRQLQLTINRLHTWATDNGFKFSTSKTVCVHFCRVRCAHPDPTLTLDGTILPFKDTVRFLGLCFDKNLSWRPHLDALKQKCRRSLDLLRVLSHKSWGADRTAMLRLYRALVRSKLDYGCVAYGSARHSVLRTIDTIHHTGIRLATGAFRTSPAPSLLCEAGEPSLYDRRRLLSIRYAAGLAARPDHPAYSVAFSNRYEQRYDSRPQTSKPFGIRARDTLRDLGLEMPVVASLAPIAKPPWMLPQPQINYKLASLKKETTLPDEYQLELLRALVGRFRSTFIFTDGSKSDDLVGCAFVAEGRQFKYRLHAISSVYTAELYAIYKALDFVCSELNCPCVILTDSLSALKSIEAFSPVHPLIQRIRLLLATLDARGMSAELFWVPGHAGIRGNEAADRAAKEATERPYVDVNFAFADDVKAYLKQLVFKDWQLKWQSIQSNKLRAIKEDTKPWISSCRSNRREETAITRLRIGHCWWTHGYLLRSETAPICETCDTALTVSHILLECVQFADARDRAGLSMELSLALGDNSTLMDRLVLFLRESNLLYVL